MFTSREFFGILGPVIIDQFFMYLISMLTTAMISASSQDSVSAVSLVNPILFLVMALFGAVANGGTVVVAQYKGKGNPLRVRQAARTVPFWRRLLLRPWRRFCCACLLIRLLCCSSAPRGESVCGRATEYLIGMAISFLPFSFYSASFSALRGVGDSKSCLRLTIIINVIHLVLSMIFLNVMHLDIFGTILSYFLARIVGGATALYSLMNKHGQIGVRFSDIFRFEPKLLKSIFRMGIPFAIEQCFYNGGTVIVQTYMVQLGNIAVAANANRQLRIQSDLCGGLCRERGNAYRYRTVHRRRRNCACKTLWPPYGMARQCNMHAFRDCDSAADAVSFDAVCAGGADASGYLSAFVDWFRLHAVCMVRAPMSCRIRCALRAMRILLLLPRLYACGWRASALDICLHCRLVSASTACGLPWA